MGGVVGVEVRAPKAGALPGLRYAPTVECVLSLKHFPTLLLLRSLVFVSIKLSPPKANSARLCDLQAALREIAASRLIQTIVKTWSWRTRRVTSGNEDDVAAVMRCHRSFYSVVAVTGGTQISATKRSLLHQRKKHRHKNQNVNR